MPGKIRLLILTFFLCLIAYLIYDEIARPQKRKNKFGMAKCVITNVTFDVMTGHSAEISYKAQMNGKEIIRTKRVASDKCSNMAKFFILMNRSMDVVYEKNDPDNCELLLTRKEYKEYKLMPPRDILNIIDDLEIACGDYK